LELNPPIPPIVQKQQQQDQTANQIPKQQPQTIFRNETKFSTNRNNNKQPAKIGRNRITENARDSTATSSTSGSDSDTNT
jgi:hypothetical protein